MISKSKLKYFASLNQKKFRQKEKKFIVEGLKSVTEGLNSKYSCDAILYTKYFAETNPDVIKSIFFFKAEKFEIKNPEFLKISDTKTPQGIAAVFQYPLHKNYPKQSDSSIVYLDNINDPGNLGTIIRTCDWFGVNTLLLSKECAEFTNPKVVRSSAGSIFHIEIHTDVSAENLGEMKNKDYKIFCSDLAGENIFKIKFPEKLVVVFSNEAHGPSKEILEIADKKITIPKTGNAESLNVAIASGIILAQLTQKL